MRVNRKSPSYEVCRRRLGITYVGSLVSLCLICLCFSVPSKVFASANESTAVWFFNVMLCVFGLTFFSLPFDMVGFNIEHRFGKDSRTYLQYLAALIPSTFKFAILLMSSILFFTCAARTHHFLMLLLAGIVLSIFAAWKQAEIARFLSPLEFQELGAARKAYLAEGVLDQVDIVVALNSDDGFTGGIVGLPTRESVIVPASWFKDLTSEEITTEIRRRAIAIKSGNRTIGLLCAIAFVVVGLTVSAGVTKLVYGLQLESTAGVVTTSMLSTIWTFLGLLVLPGISQKSVNQIDWMTVESGASISVLKQTISMLSQKTENEIDRTDSVQLIFHPVPTAARRIAELESPSGVRLWNVSRYAVWLSFAGLGLLGRAVHCNAGKPELWCILPTD